MEVPDLASPEPSVVPLSTPSASQKVILGIPDFDEQQKSSREDEMCKDLKRIVHTVRETSGRIGAYLPLLSVSKENTYHSQQHELLQAPEVQSPSPLLHALAHAESHPSDMPLPLPITEVNPKFTELPASEIDRKSSKQLQMFCGNTLPSERSAK